MSSAKISDEDVPFNDISEAIEEEIVAQTRARIAVGRHETQVRIRPHLDNMSAILDGFEERVALAN